MRNGPCWCGSGKKWKKCHYPAVVDIASPKLAQTYRKQFGILLKTPAEIAGIRAACHLSATILDTLCRAAKAGVTTAELNDLSTELHEKAGSTAAALGYGAPPFPAGICTSLNDVICHGIPGPTPLQEGDILNIDVASILDGYYGDCSRMVMVGKVSPEKKQLVDVAYDCLMESIAILKPGVLLREIGEVIEQIAHEAGFSVVNQFVGHGVGVDFHEPPQVPHHRNDMAIPLAPGMTFTIEPMINVGVRAAIVDSDDQWTARTADGEPSAQWEHSLLITETGHEILTLI
jgi:methionyl aminopeptidase